MKNCNNNNRETAKISAFSSEKIDKQYLTDKEILNDKTR